MNDDEIIELLAEVVRHDGPPASALELAYGSFAWRTIDADLARLVDDREVEVVGFHHGAYSRLVTYDADQGTIEIGVADDAFEVGALPTPAQVVLHRAPTGAGAPLEPTEVPLDSQGRGRGQGVSGPVRFEVTWSTGSVVTPWLTL
jgi:hypothetical protein